MLEFHMANKISRVNKNPIVVCVSIRASFNAQECCYHIDISQCSKSFVQCWLKQWMYFL